MSTDYQENAIYDDGDDDAVAGFLTGDVDKFQVNRDVLTNNLTQVNEVALVQPVYAGTTTGDMVSWSIDSLDGATYSWWATGPQGQEVDGPSGEDEWTWNINNAGPDVIDQWLTWNPGQWTIHCTVNDAYTFDFTQEIGWRTEDYLVIGQIVKTTAYYGNQPTWAQTISFRDATLLDNPILALEPDTLIEQLALLPWPFRNWHFGVLDLAGWGYQDHSVTPQGPFTVTYSYGLGTLSEPQDLWMVESAHNVTVDIPTSPGTIPANTVFPTIGDGQYRLFNHFQTRFLVNDDGLINQGSVYNISHAASVGQTKYMIPAGLFLPVWNSPAVGLTDQESETDSNNGFHASSDGTRLSEFVSGRVGFEGQNDIWRFFGHDAPWPFVEIIAQLNEDGSVSTSINTSVDVTWYDDGSFLGQGSMTGSAPFNNLNIYKATLTPNTNGTSTLNYVQKANGPLSMSGHLQAFLDMVSFGTWPAPAPSPSVQ